MHVSSKQKILKYSIKFHFRSVMNIMIVFFCVFQTKQNLCVFQRCYIYQCHMEEVISLTSNHVSSKLVGVRAVRRIFFTRGQ